MSVKVLLCPGFAPRPGRELSDTGMLKGALAGGQSSDGRHRAKQNLRSGQLIYEPALSGGLHPRSGQRYELTDEEQTEISMLQGGKGVTP